MIWSANGHPPKEPPEVDDPRVIHAMQEYLHALEVGGTPDRDTFLRTHADSSRAQFCCV